MGTGLLTGRLRPKRVPFLKGHCHGIFTFWGEKCAEISISMLFSHKQNTPRTSRKGNQMVFSKKEQRENLKTSA